MDTDYTQDTQYKNIALKVDPELYALIKTAAHRREMSIAQFVRTTLKEASQFYAGQA